MVYTENNFGMNFILKQVQVESLIVRSSKEGVGSFYVVVPLMILFLVELDSEFAWAIIPELLSYAQLKFQFNSFY